MIKKLTNKNFSKGKKIALYTLSIILVLIVILCAVINHFVLSKHEDKIINIEVAGNLENIDCIIVLGCGIRADNSPSNMLEDRLKVGIDIYMLNKNNNLLMSGDHENDDYNEVGVMKDFAIKLDVPSEKIFLDHLGLSTYDSLYRAKHKFNAKNIIIVTQGYHLPRALYIAHFLGINAYGVSADLRPYRGSATYEAREILARLKDFTFLNMGYDLGDVGQPVSLLGDGNDSNDRHE